MKKAGDRGYNDRLLENCFVLKDLLIFINATIYLLFWLESTFHAVFSFPRKSVDSNRDSFYFVL